MQYLNIFKFFISAVSMTLTAYLLWIWCWWDMASALLHTHRWQLVVVKSTVHSQGHTHGCEVLMQISLLRSSLSGICFSTACWKRLQERLRLWAQLWNHSPCHWSRHITTQWNWWTEVHTARSCLIQQQPPNTFPLSLRELWRFCVELRALFQMLSIWPPWISV